MMTLLSEVCSLLDAGESVALITIAGQSGSTPRESGAKMAVRADGSILGTVGGGVMEARSMELGLALLNGSLADAAIRTFDLTNEEAAKSAMVCGGRLTVLAERIDCRSAADTQLLRNLKETLLGGRACRCVTEYRWASQPVAAAAEASSETLRYMHSVARRLETADGGGASGQIPCELQCGEQGCVFAEMFFPQPRLFIFGAGHVAKPTAHMAHMVGFSVTVLDDRAEFAHPARFPQSQVRVISDFFHAFEGLGVTPGDYLVIMTRGHLHDCTVLEQALTTQARYIGMIGSRRKRDALYETLRSKGVAEQSIARCHCPVGLSIQAQTPEEIAVSIVAELIQCRAANP